MSDYMFMLESHLSGEQSKVVSAVRSAAEEAGLNLFLTGGAMRDMMGGFPIRDLDFTVEGSAIKLAKAVSQETDAEIAAVDELRKTAELRFPGGITASIGMARTETYSKPAAKPQVHAATIHEDLRGRDFTVNAIALSLSKASRGLLLDPTNGLGDLGCKELRTITSHTLWDDPVRILRLLRLRVRLAFAAESRTWAQYQSVREAKLETKISEAALHHELRQIALDPLSGEILRALDEENLLQEIAPGIAGPKLNVAGFQKLAKARQILPFGANLQVDWFPVFLSVLFEKLTPRERSQVAGAFGLEKADLDAVTRLDSRARKLEKEIEAIKVHRPSALYAVVSKVGGELLVYLLMRSSHRIVLDRLKNYLQKYLPLAQEVTEKNVIDAGAEPGTPKFLKIQQQLIAARLDARPKKVVVEEPPPPPPIVTGRRSSSFAR